MIRLCFVCLGNICRSPTAEGIMRRQVVDAALQDLILVDSAGTEAYHVGERADPRSRATAGLRGVELSSRGRQFDVADFEHFDYVLAMDRDNHGDLIGLAPDGAARRRLHLLREFEADSEAPATSMDVPDPYYGGDDGFERVFDICEAACRGLLEHLIDEHGLH